MPTFPASSPFFDFDVSASDGTMKVTLAGEIDGAAAEQLEPLSNDMAAGSRVVVDVGAVSFIDSMGLRVLVGWHHCVTDSGGTLELLAPSATLQRLLAVTSLDRVFTVSERQPEPTAFPRPSSVIS
jgi:anti-sigma B factor antagonist